MRDRRHSPMGWILFDFHEEVKGLIAAEIKIAHFCSSPRRVLFWENHFGTSKYHLEHLRNVHRHHVGFALLNHWTPTISHAVRGMHGDSFACTLSFLSKSSKNWSVQSGCYMCYFIGFNRSICVLIFSTTFIRSFCQPRNISARCESAYDFV